MQRMAALLAVLVLADFGRMLSVGTVFFEDKFSTSQKLWDWERAYSWHTVNMATALASCRTALVSTGWTIPHLVSTNGLRNHSSPCRGTISRSVGSFQSGWAIAGGRALTIESSLMSGCSYCHEPAEYVSKTLWLKFPQQASSRSGNMDQRSYPHCTNYLDKITSSSHWVKSTPSFWQDCILCLSSIVYSN